MKKALLLILSLLFLSSCAPKTTNTADDKIKITATIFPQYDFSKQIAQDLANVTMLLPPGGESHTYEPTPKDIIEIENSDIFIYTGGESDVWIESVLNSINTTDIKVICLTDICDIIEHNHDNVHTVDEHVWTSPVNVLKISEEIKNVLSEIDSKNASVYEKNFERYKTELENLDSSFKEITKTPKRNVLIFGDRFPFWHLTEEYDLKYLSAFPGCAEETEPDIKTVKSLIDMVNEMQIPVVFYTDFSNHKIADTICEETGAKLSMLRSCHTVTKEEMENNITYIDLMRHNVLKIKEAIN